MGGGGAFFVFFALKENVRRKKQIVFFLNPKTEFLVWSSGDGLAAHGERGWVATMGAADVAEPQHPPEALPRTQEHVYSGPGNDSHLHLRPPRTQAHSHRIPTRCVTITDTDTRREYCSMLVVDVQRL